MVSTLTATKLALSFDEVVELPHFDRSSFRVGKKIFATLNAENKMMCVLLSPMEQSLFCSFDQTIIYPVPNKWGLKGATYVDLKKVRKSTLNDALSAAYCRVAPKRLAAKYLNNVQF